MGAGIYFCDESAGRLRLLGEKLEAAWAVRVAKSVRTMVSNSNQGTSEKVASVKLTEYDLMIILNVILRGDEKQLRYL